MLVQLQLVCQVCSGRNGTKICRGVAAVTVFCVWPADICMYVCMYNVLGTVWGNRQISVHAEHMAGLVIARTSFTRWELYKIMTNCSHDS